MQTSSSQRVRLARAHDDRPDQAQRFYSDVVGISVLLMGEGPGAYRLAMVDDTPVGGFVGLATADPAWPSGGPKPYWVASFGARGGRTHPYRLSHEERRTLLADLERPSL